MIISVNFCHLAWRKQTKRKNSKKITTETEKRQREIDTMSMLYKMLEIDRTENAATIFLCKSRMKITNRTWCYIIRSRGPYAGVWKCIPRFYLHPPPPKTQPITIYWWTDNTNIRIKMMILHFTHPFHLCMWVSLSVCVSYSSINSHVDEHHVVMAILHMSFSFCFHFVRFWFVSSLAGALSLPVL